MSGSEKLDLSLWKTNIADRWDSLTEPVRIALIGVPVGGTCALLKYMRACRAHMSDNTRPALPNCPLKQMEE